MSYEQMKSADRYFSFLYDGRKFLIAVNRRAIDDDLQSVLSNAIEYLDKNWRDFSTSPAKRSEIVEQLDTIGETIIEKAEDILINS